MTGKPGLASRLRHSQKAPSAAPRSVSSPTSTASGTLRPSTGSNEADHGSVLAVGCSATSGMRAVIPVMGCSAPEVSVIVSVPCPLIWQGPVELPAEHST